ncbi:hypothetical protein LCGC14_2584580, partial [marine sediment metagenome]
MQKSNQIPIIMGILNLSPESPVSQSTVSVKKAKERAYELVNQGATIIDVGGNSSSSKAREISITEEKERVIPVIESLIEEEFIVSIDSWTPEVVLESAKIGIQLINDINGLENPKMIKIAKDYNLQVSIMHMKGKPKKHYEVVQSYENISFNINDWLMERTNDLLKNGLTRDQIIIDPGFGFGKGMENNLQILKDLHIFRKIGYPLLVSASRKSFIAEAIGLGKVQQGEGLYEATLAIQVIAALNEVNIFEIYLLFCKLMILNIQFSHSLKYEVMY